MFLEIEDLGTTIYDYQVEQITEGNEQITVEALATAEEEVRSYLSLNNKREKYDGRLIYDVDKILSATGTARNPMIKNTMISIAKWHIVDLCNADIIYEQAKERYDRAITWLNKLSKGDLTLSTLPIIDNNSTETDDDSTAPFAYGSREKFNHE
ncbi:phage protein Gp36 family protein [Empedobacter falsenii]